MKKNQDQQTLFGEIDQVFNCLHTELTVVNEEIESAYKRIINLEVKIESLKARKKEIQKAIEIVGEKRGQVGEKELEEESKLMEEDEEAPESPEFPEEEFVNPDGAKQNSVIRCPNCRALILKDATVCPSCGNEL